MAPLGGPEGVCAWSEVPGEGWLMPLGEEEGLCGAGRFDLENWGAVPFGLVDSRLWGA